jgi:hypothetical protein
LTWASSCAITPASSPHDPGRRRDGGVLGVAPGREGVRRRVIDEVDARHREFGPLGQFGDDLVEFRGIGGGDLFRARHLQGDLVAEPVGPEVHRDGEDEGDDHPARPADRATDDDK